MTYQINEKDYYIDEKDKVILIEIINQMLFSWKLSNQDFKIVIDIAETILDKINTNNLIFSNKELTLLYSCLGFLNFGNDKNRRDRICYLEFIFKELLKEE